ncbi:MAG: ABC transporter ATP-binding protein [Chloroflexota bacterium]|nr:ABC transporter ATP-binding protein [Chloroflexota bacterium]
MAAIERAEHPAAIALEGVTFAYGAAGRGELVARGVSLAVAPGEMVALLGPNGAGKSTLLKLASGALRPQAGRALVDGRDLRALPRDELARRVALAPQDFSVQFAYTVRQVVELGRTPHLGSWGTLRPRDRAAVDAALAEAGLGALADRVFDELSGGERQRALVALTLAQQAPTLLLDEPTAHLDIRHQIETLELLRRLNAERGLTVIATMHDLNLAARYFPRLILYKRGVVADGPPTEALDEATLAAVYETPVRVGILRGDERLSVAPPAQGAARDGTAEGVALQAHVLAGGGSGELVMRALVDAGAAFSAGPLNVGDSDCALAERPATLTLVEPPYAPLSPEGLTAARERMVEAGAVIVCPSPLGPGNIALLDAALAAQQAGARIILLEPGLGGRPSDEATAARDAAGLALVAARDFSGRGRDAYAALLAGGATWAATPTAALHAALG